VSDVERIAQIQAKARAETAPAVIAEDKATTEANRYHDGAYPWLISAAADRLPVYIAAIEAVLELHKQTFYDKWSRPTNDLAASPESAWCSTCGRAPADGCPTFTAITGLLQ